MPTNRRRKKAELSRMRACDRHILETLELADRMLALADEGDMDREDVGCGVLYGILRDAAYKLKKAALKEARAHQKKGWWISAGNDLTLFDTETITTKQGGMIE
jgi:hypothetical protein